MTIEELIKELKIVEERHNQSLTRSKKEIDRLRGVVKEYQAKESELEGSLIIQKGWDILEARHDRGQFKCTLEPTKGYINQRIAGYGITAHEALRNALEQIETKQLYRIGNCDNF